ncbi:hypothetical protein NK553_26845 [Pseudomonas sp. ZM23]|uniref:Uncharacterized protein n=1 Tax=Pseudomonas triclosanedens TaxID=2961893 RepID=A0ABY7A7B6_9PSED|nr:hypothetical protein [Pseudomonas triclosanedens]MCP8467577.1 hypothetical protein [Pseudomonas triclosanedens]MCP8471754.1 hypothetical protein [Pseudomonas triclosanedens]MCP8478893.1 hypothetical protein [Pseudomonas triclosanedens]WAI52376.1 hypothetical protein OU419_14340 [Pseudomonas triclosanedens]
MTPAFLISYILNDQPMSVVLHQEQLSVDDARRFLVALHSPLDERSITDVQVSKVLRSQERDTTPGHYRQP